MTKPTPMTVAEAVERYLDYVKASQSLGTARTYATGLRHFGRYLESESLPPDETGVEALFLDVLTPWDYLDQARTALRGGGVLGSILPTINQVQQMARALYDGPWFMVEIEEVLVRDYKVVPDRIRPQDRMVAHTGYLMFARAVSHRSEADETEVDV